MFYVQHVKYTSEDTQRRQGTGKRACPLSRLKCLFHEMSIQTKKKRRKRKTSSKPQPQSCWHYRLADNTRTFSFALPAFPIYPRGVLNEGEKKNIIEKRSSRASQRLTGLCSKQQLCDLYGQF